MHLLIFRLEEINRVVVRAAAHKYEKILNPIGDTETQQILVKFGSFLHVVYSQSEMTQFLRDDAAAAKVLTGRLHSYVQLNYVPLGIAQL